MRQAKTQHNEDKATVRLNLDLRYFWYPGFLALIFFAPLARGLFFPADLLPFQIMAAILMGIAVFDTVLSGRALDFRPLHWGFLALALSYGVSAIHGVAKAQALQGFLRYMTYFGILWLSFCMAQNKKSRNAILITLFLSGFSVASVGILSALNLVKFPGASDGARILSTLQYPNALAAYMMFTSLLGLTLWLLERRPVVRAFYGIGIFVQTLTFLNSFSRGGWLIYPFALIALFAGIPRSRRGGFLLLTVGNLTAILFTLRQFVTALESRAYGPARVYFLAGAAICGVVQLGFVVYEKMSDRIFMSTAAKRIMSWVVGGYAIVIVLIYGAMTLGQYGVGVSGILPASFVKRLSTIGLEDPSLLTRTFATGDALKIFLDHPLFGTGAGGWNALYHQYQRVLYWTTEVHNHAAQVLVESGIFGFISYVFIWITLGFYMIKAVFLTKDVSSRSRTRIWGCSVAAMSLGVHSLMDFELSLPGVFYQLCALSGVIEAVVFSPEVLASKGYSDETLDPAPEKSRRKRAIALVGVFCASMVIGIPSYRFERAGFYGSLGAQALLDHDFRRAEALYLEAEKLDPYTASYSVDLAQTYAALFLLENRVTLRDQCLNALAQASAKDPTNLPIKLKEIEVRQSIGDAEGAWVVARELPAMVPLDVQSYEVFARASVISFMNSVKGEGGGNNSPDGDLRQKNIDKYLTPVIDIPAKLETLKGTITGVYAKKWDPNQLNVSENLALYVGQANVLAGHIQTGRTFLEKASKSQSISSEARTWLNACDVLDGKTPAEMTDEVKMVLSYCKR